MLISKELRQRLETGPPVIVAITGLRLKRPWHIFRFTWLAIPAFNQARNSSGSLLVEAKTIRGVRHTLTVWNSRSDMTEFLYSGAHKRAIKAFPEIATGKTFSYESDSVPDWAEVHARWLEQGLEYAPIAQRLPNAPST